MRKQYPKTKMLNIFFTRELASRLPVDSPLVVNCLTPGLCSTELRREFPWLLSWIYVIVDAGIAWSAERGSRQLVFAALGYEKREDDLKGVYVSSSEITEPSDFVISNEGKAVQKQAWVGIFSWSLPPLLIVPCKSRMKPWTSCTKSHRSSGLSWSLWEFDRSFTPTPSVRSPCVAT